MYQIINMKPQGKKGLRPYVPRDGDIIPDDNQPYPDFSELVKYFLFLCILYASNCINTLFLQDISTQWGRQEHLHLREQPQVLLNPLALAFLPMRPWSLFAVLLLGSMPRRKTLLCLNMLRSYTPCTYFSYSSLLLLIVCAVTRTTLSTFTEPL